MGPQSLPGPPRSANNQPEVAQQQQGLVPRRSRKQRQQKQPLQEGYATLEKPGRKGPRRRWHSQRQLQQAGQQQQQQEEACLGYQPMQVTLMMMTATLMKVMAVPTMPHPRVTPTTNCLSLRLPFIPLLLRSLLQPFQRCEALPKHLYSLACGANYCSATAHRRASS